MTGKDGTYDPVVADAPLHAVVDRDDATDAAAGLRGQTAPQDRDPPLGRFRHIVTRNVTPQGAGVRGGSM